MSLDTLGYQDALAAGLKPIVRIYSGTGINAGSFVGSGEGEPDPGAHEEAIAAANARADQFSQALAQVFAEVTETYIKSGRVQVTITPGSVPQLGPPNPAVIFGEVT